MESAVVVVEWETMGWVRGEGVTSKEYTFPTMVAMFWNILIERRKSRDGSQSILLYLVLGWSLGSTLSLHWRRHTSLFLYINEFLYWLNIHQAQHRMEQNQYRIKWYTSEQEMVVSRVRWKLTAVLLDGFTHEYEGFQFEGLIWMVAQRPKGACIL